MCFIVYLYSNSNNNTTRSLGVQRKHRSIIPFLMLCITFGLSIIYASFGLISQLPTATTFDKIEVEDSPQLLLPTHASHLRGLAGSIPQSQQDDNTHESIQQTAYWNVSSWLDFEAKIQPHRLKMSAEKSNYMCSTNPSSINTTIAAAATGDMLTVSFITIKSNKVMVYD